MTPALTTDACTDPSERVVAITQNMWSPAATLVKSERSVTGAVYRTAARVNTLTETNVKTTAYAATTARLAAAMTDGSCQPQISRNTDARASTSPYRMSPTAAA